MDIDNFFESEKNYIQTINKHCSTLCTTTLQLIFRGMVYYVT